MNKRAAKDLPVSGLLYYQKISNYAINLKAISIKIFKNVKYKNKRIIKK